MTTSEPDLFGNIGPDGKVVPTVARPKRPEPLRFETNATRFYGAEIRTEDHPLIPSPTIVDHYQLDDNAQNRKQTEDALKLMSMGECVFFVGPHGTGKTETAKYWAAGARRPLFQKQGHAHFEWRELTGKMTLKNGASQFQYGPLVKAAQAGGVLLIDEAPSIKQGILNGLNDILNNLGKGIREFPIDGEEGHEMIEVKDGFTVVLTGNPWDRYVGNNELNLAFLSRMHVREKWYLGEEAEVRLLHADFPTINQQKLHELVQFGNASRNRWRATPDAYQYVVCTRTLQKVCMEMEHLKATALEAVNSVVYSVVRLAAPDELKSLQTLAEQSISKNSR